MTRPLPVDAAIRHLREQPGGVELLEHLYLDEDPNVAARRFGASAEWREATDLLGDLPGRVVVDVGAGGGAASAAFADEGCEVIALEPDSSPAVGSARLQQVAAHRTIRVVEAPVESIPLRSGSVDVVYCRQVLHHARDLDQALRECARVLRPGGQFLACREHVVRSDKELRQFLAAHPVHQLAGGEHAFTLERYLRAIGGSHLTVMEHLGPWQSVMNAFPIVQSADELARIERIVCEARVGVAGAAVLGLPVLRQLVRRWITRPKPGEMHSFLAVKC